MRLGGPVLNEHPEPAEWLGELTRLRYRAAFWPYDEPVDGHTTRELVEGARRADVVIAEVWAWSNPLSPDDAERRAALAYCTERLALADEVGARCCVNIAGSRSAAGGPHADNLTRDTFDLIVDTVRGVIDAARPARTSFALETMPWVYPDSIESYLHLLAAVDRERFAVHLDPVNLICSPQRYFANGAFIRECFRTLGPAIRSCHAKDVLLAPKQVVHLDSVRPGLGGLDYHTFIAEVERIDPDMPVLLEELDTEEEYALAAEYVRAVAREVRS